MGMQCVRNGIFICVYVRRYDTQAENMRSQSFNMEQATMAIQTAKDTQVVIGAMKTGVTQMKKEFKKINIDNIDVSIIISQLTRTPYW